MNIWTGFNSWEPWQFSGVDKEQRAQNVNMNMASYYKWFYQFVNIACSMFKWEGLPEGIDERQLEIWLLTRGYAILFYDEALKDDPQMRAPEGYAVLPGVASGQLDLYNIGTERRVYAPNGYQKELTPENSVLIFNNRIRTPEIFVYMLYAQRIADIDRTIDINTMNQKSPKLVRCEDSQRLTFKNVVMQTLGNVYSIFVDKNFNASSMDVLDLTVPFVGEDMDRLKRRYISECMTYMGVEGVNTDKKERLIGQEVLRGMGDVEAMRFTRLVEREQACERANEIFGLDLSVDYRSGIYIQTGNTKADLSPTTGMLSGQLSPEVGGYGNE